MAALLGAVAYLPTIEIVDDFRYLTDSLDAFDIDFAPSTSGFILDNFPPYISEINSISGGNTLTKNSLTVISKNITTSHIAYSYVFDFYYRIHLSYYSLNLGNILSEQNHTLEIWNAWRSDNTLTTIDSVDLSDILINLGIALPTTFTPLQYINANINVAALGTPSINGYFDFQFDTETPRLIIIGQRILFWPFVPQDEYSETKLWNTDIIPSIEGEQRFVVRDIPRLIFSYKFVFRTQHEYSMAKTRARTMANLAIATAIWTNVVFVENIPAGSTTISFNTDYRELANDTVLVIYESFEIFELVEISSFTSTTVTLKNPTLITHTNCWVAPVKTGYLSNGIEFNRSENHEITSNINITITNPFNLAVWPTSDTYLGLPVLPEITIASGGLSERLFRVQEEFDSISGELVKFDTETYTRSYQTIRLKAEGLEERYNLKRQFDYLQGKYQLFWLPSFNKDLIAVTQITIGVNSFKVVNYNWANHPDKYIKVIGSTVGYFEVLSVTDNLDGTESLEIFPTPTESITSISSIQILTQVRLNSDRLEFRNKGNFTMVSSPVIEVV